MSFEDRLTTTTAFTKRKGVSITLPEKALTIHQPWAWAIFHAGQDVANRNWSTRFRGPVAIHSSAKFDYVEWLMFKLFLRERSIPITPPEAHRKSASRAEYLTGAILGIVEIVDCVQKSASPWFMGEYGFVLANPIALPEPIPCKGARGFWDIPTMLEGEKQ